MSGQSCADKFNSSALGGLPEFMSNSANWASTMFNEASRGQQQLIMGVGALFGAAIFANLVANTMDIQGKWSGTFLKWAAVIGAVALATSDVNPWMKKSYESEPEVIRTNDPRLDRDKDGIVDRRGDIPRNEHGQYKPGHW